MEAKLGSIYYVECIEGSHTFKGIIKYIKKNNDNDLLFGKVIFTKERKIDVNFINKHDEILFYEKELKKELKQKDYPEYYI